MKVAVPYQAHEESSAWSHLFRNHRVGDALLTLT